MIYIVVEIEGSEDHLYKTESMANAFNMIQTLPTEFNWTLSTTPFLDENDKEIVDCETL